MNTDTVNILLVEDDDVDAEAIERAFEKAKIANPVFRARDGLEALEMLRAKGADEIARPYIVLLDLKMPRMNGLAFLDEIRLDEDLRDSVVFVLTTSAAEKDVSAAYEKYVAGYIVKSQVGSSFKDLIGLLDYYWRVVALPTAAH
ncbi:MAG: response regulator [Gammaproteobacteria bacterium]|nr:response regulator [Gammaproteobacteria bacterium]